MLHNGGGQLVGWIGFALWVKQHKRARVIVGQIKRDLVNDEAIGAVIRGLQRVAKLIVAAEFEQAAVGMVMAL